MNYAPSDTASLVLQRYHYKVLKNAAQIARKDHELGRFRLVL